MLVLSRKQQQQIQIGETITVTVLRVKGNTVRLGIDAPRQVRVIRGELPSHIEVVETSQHTDGLPPSGRVVLGERAESRPTRDSLPGAPGSDEPTVRIPPLASRIAAMCEMC